MKTIHFYGALADKYGDSIQLEITTVTGLIKAMYANHPNFIDDIRGSDYQVINIHDGKENTITEDELEISFTKGDFHITPVIEGELAAMTWVIIVIIAIVVSVAAMYLMMPEPMEEDETEKSFGFGGGLNNIKQGGPVPLIYGEAMCGSTVVSTSLTNEDTSTSSSLTSNATVKIIDVISEGEIEGFADADYEKSIYLNETQYKDDGGYNFEGVSTALKYGTSDQTYLPAYSTSSITSVTTKLVYETPIVKTITNTNVDECQITIKLPGLYRMSSKGKTKSIPASFNVWINDIFYSSFTIRGKTKSEYYKTYLLPKLSNYGAGPWTIKLDRVSAESTSTKKAESIYWESYAELINEKLPYYNTALVGFTADAEQFGQKLPSRMYKVKGIKVKYPSNYDPETRVYTGVWDGSFTTGYTNNPAWVYYDLLNKSRYGANIAAADIDKWTLYTSAQLCDEMIDDGDGGTEPRFTINVVIDKQEDAMKVLSSIASVFRAMSFWYNGQASIVQDKYKLPTQVITNANIKDGEFNYSGTSLENKITEISVEWRDPDDLYRKAVEVVTDSDGVTRYGIIKKNITAYGCTSRSQAHRFGLWYLYTELHQREAVEYTCSFDQLNCIPGEIVIINDSHFITKRHGGKVKSATTTQIVIDAAVELESGKTYTIRLVNAEGELVTTDITTAATTTDTLAITAIAAGDVPQVWSNFSINSSSYDERLFKVMKMNVGDENEVKVTAVLHDNDKYDAVDNCITFDDKHYTDVEEGPLDAPTNLVAEEYTSGDGFNDTFGVILSWTHTNDTRLVDYDVEIATTSGIYEDVTTTIQSSYVYEPVTSGTLYYRVRGNSISTTSAWTSNSITILADPDPLPDITGLQVVGGGAVFSGRNIEVEWTAVDMTLGRFQCYTIKVYTTSDVLLRTYNTVENSYIYTYEMNEEDNTDGIRNIKFEVYVKDVYDKLSTVAAVLSVSNPAPDYAGTSPAISAIFKGVKINWSNIVGNDNDLDKFEVYSDTSNPPTTLVATVSAETYIFIVTELDTDDTYYAQVQPYDVFGAGTKSSIVNEIPLKLGIVDVDSELTHSITMSDSDSNSAATLAKLYDRNKISDGITYIVT